MHNIFIVCSYDVVFTAGADVILTKFKDFNCRVVFSAEGFCWPDKTLAVSLFCLRVSKHMLPSLQLAALLCLWLTSVKRWKKCWLGGVTLKSSYGNGVSYCT